MWHEVGAVFQLEYRRHVRSRAFWRLLLLLAGLSLLSAAGGVWGMYATDSVVGARLAMGVLASLGVVAMIAPAVVVPRIFSDMYKTREMYDIYLTALHPVAIVVGRILTASVQVGLVLLVLFPAGMLLCRVAGFPPGYWLGVLVLTWCALVLWMGISAQAMGKRFPPDQEGALHGQSSNSMNGVIWAGVLALLLWGAFSVAIDWVHLPFSLALPPLIPYEAKAYALIGRWELPLWLLALPMMVGVTVLATVSTAQWLGWWSDNVYRWQRFGGSALFLMIYGLNLAIYAQSMVRSPSEATQTVFWGILVGVMMYTFLFAPLLGYYGMGLRLREARFVLPPPLGGVVWEWGLMVGVACTAWLAVGWASGYWVSPARWLVWSVYLLGLTMLAQARISPMLTFAWLWLRQPPLGRHLNRVQVRASIEAYCMRAVQQLFSTLLWLFITGGFLSRLPWWVLEMAGRVLLWLNPLYGVSSPTKPLSLSAVYLGYTLLLVVALTVWGVRRARTDFERLVSKRTMPAD